MSGSVVDASVLGAFLFGESRAREAGRLLRAGPLFAPPLLAYELTSIARKKADARPRRRQALAAALEIGLSMEIQWTEVDHRAVLDLALDVGLTSYDAAVCIWPVR